MDQVLGAHLTTYMFVGLALSMHLACTGTDVRPEEVHQSVETFESILNLIVMGSDGRLEEYLACRPACARPEHERDIATIKVFFRSRTDLTLSHAMGTVGQCIDRGLYLEERLVPTCDGALLALGFFDDEADEAMTLAFFERYLRAGSLTTRQMSSLRNAFSARIAGGAWFPGRNPEAWLSLLRRLNERCELFSPDGWAGIESAIRTPPLYQDRSRFLFPPRSIHRLLRSLTSTL